MDKKMLDRINELAKKKKNVLEYQEISDFFKDQPLEVERAVQNLSR